jgi:hypothetical protein
MVSNQGVSIFTAMVLAGMETDTAMAMVMAMDTEVNMVAGIMWKSLKR